MFGKLFASVAAAGVLAAVVTTGAMAAPAGAPLVSPAKQQRQASKDVFGGMVTAVSEGQLTVKNGKGASQTFLRTDKTIVLRGRNDRAAWSEIEVNSTVRVRFQALGGKLDATRIHIGRARLSGKVEGVSGNLITVRTRDGKEVRITVTAATKYFQLTGKKQRQAGSLKEIHSGQHLAAAGTYDASHNFDAAIVTYRNK